MGIPIIFAHGALGAFDEVVFVSVILIFLVLMVLSWVRSRNLPDDDLLELLAMRRDFRARAEDTAAEEAHE